ncbi:MAG: GDSL-type esterase/lipase family protein [Victivallales bacterium]|nr:GDSL-type esterase/lipase family protein [Victivallales bacterium]
MKKIIFCSLFFVFAVFEITAEELPMQVPPVIYAVPGIECNVYFENLVLTLNPADYAFDVDCLKGHNDTKRWRFIPENKDNGTFTWRIRVFNSRNQMVASGESRLIVIPRSPGKGKKKSILMLGDSLTDHSVYPKTVLQLAAEDGIELNMIGTNAGGGRKPEPGGVAHEGYGGWSWETFMTRWTDETAYTAKSKFLFMKDGKLQFDLQAYLKKYANGIRPDFITIMLGTNDVFKAGPGTLAACVKRVMENIDKLVSAMQKSAPDARIGIALTIPPANSQDAFGANYKCRQTRWQFRCNQFRLVAAMIARYAGGKVKNVSLIPAFAEIDCENNFPRRRETVNQRNPDIIMRAANGVHPGNSGYQQIGDIFYAWLKYQSAKPEQQNF